MPFEIALDGKVIPNLVLKGSGQGGVQYLGYVGNTAVHDISIIMPDLVGPVRDVFGVSSLELSTTTGAPNLRRSPC